MKQIKDIAYTNKTDPQVLIQKYEDFLNVTGKAPNTVYRYVSFVKQIVNRFNIQHIKDLTPDVIMSFRSSSTLGGTSMNIALRSVKSFFRWLFAYGYVAEDYSKSLQCKEMSNKEAKRIRGPKQSEDPDAVTGRALTKAEIKRLLHKVSKNHKMAMKNWNITFGEMDYIFIRVALATGLRVSDMVKLKPRHFTYSPEQDNWILRLTIRKTSRKINMWVCANQVMNDLQEYIRKGNIGEDDYLFKSTTGDSIATYVFRERFKRYVKAIGCPELNVHDLRRTHATMLYEQGVNLKVISKRLGHSSILVTESYLRLEEEMAVFDSKLLGFI